MISNKKTADQKTSKVQCKKLFAFKNSGNFWFLWYTSYAKAILEYSKISASTEDMLEMLFIS